MAQAADKDIKDLKTTIDANTKAISDLVTSFNGLREEMRIGFTDIRGELKVIDTRLGTLESTAQKLPDLAEKVGELKNWKQIAIIVFTGSVSASIAWFLRGGHI